MLATAWKQILEAIMEELLLARSIPTRIAGVSISRLGQTDGSGRSRRQFASKSILQIDSGILCEPHFLSRPVVSRTLACLDGEAYALVVDVRPKSPTLGRWMGIYLSRENRRVLNFSTNIACGWMATAARAKLRLTCGASIRPDDWQWLRWNDRELGLEWPESPLALVDTWQPSQWDNETADEFLLDVTPQVRAGHVHAPARPYARVALQQSNSLKPRRRKETKRALIERPFILEPQDSRSVNEPMQSTLQSREVKAARKASPDIKPMEPSKPLILLIGSTGQLGRDLFRHLRSVGIVVGASRSPERNQLLPVPIEVDISRPASLRQVIRQVRPQLIVNASGMTDVDRAEAEPRLAQLINATAPAILAEEAERCGAAVVHFCTDMVFSGLGERPWRETDVPEPVCQYARTKLIGTEAIRSSKCPHLILRSGWLYSTHGENYIRQTIDMSVYRSAFSLATDHFGSPTSTHWLADVTARILARGRASIYDWLGEHGGLYHCATLGYTSRAEVAEHVLADCRLHRMPVVTRTIHSVPLATLPSLATHPANCRLDCSRIAMQMGIELPRWQDQLTEQLSLMIDGNICSMHAVA